MKTRFFIRLLTPIVALVICAHAQPPATSFPVARPEDHDISAAALESVASTVGSYFDRDIIVGGVFVVIKNRQTVLSEAYGWQDRRDQTPMLPDTVFNIRSMTKMLTGAACQILIDDGRVSLSDKVADYLPGFETRRSQDITVEQLLTHRSGLPLSLLTSLNEYPTLFSMANAMGRHGPQFTRAADSGTAMPGVNAWGRRWRWPPARPWMRSFERACWSRWECGTPTICMKPRHRSAE